jgi:hypothetical protein
MITAKKKLCNKCNQEKLIWKNFEGSKYCKACWQKENKPISTTTKKIVKLKSKSTKLAALENLYCKLRIDYITKHSTCEARLPICTIQATDIHHKKGRGPFLLDISTWIAVCRVCHTYIELHPIEAKELGLSENRL